MKKLLFISLILCMGCLKEKNADPGLPDTFVRYFNGGFRDEAADIVSTSDGGYLLLATTDVRVDEVTASRFKIKMIKTDKYGNLIWQKIYPEFGSPNDSVSFKGRSVAINRDGSGLESGYVIVGDSIYRNPSSQSYLHIMLTDIDGNITRTKNINPNFPKNGSLGSSVTLDTNGNILVLSASNDPITNMFLSEFSTNLDSLWTRSYGTGPGTLANRLFIDNQSALYWTGTVTFENEGTDMRFVKTPLNSANTVYDLPLGTSQFNETGNDICPYGFGYAIIGSTDSTFNRDDDILFKRLAQDGTELASKRYGFVGQTDNGLSISQARDGGLILLGSVDTHIVADGPQKGQQIGRGGKDYFLIKINAFGDEEWNQVFGSKNDDIGKRILANADGSYVIYGTTIWGGLRTLSLIKTDNKGNIE